MTLEFVLHAHSGAGPVHYDLMLRQGGVLATWQFQADPAELAAGQSAPCRRIQDHRLHYLSHDGPISGGRGEVAMLDRGRYDLVSQDERCWRVRLAGGRLSGLYELRVEEEGEEVASWVLARLEPV
jgi:hypothetical protein